MASRLEDLSLEEVEKVLVMKALARFDGNVSLAAQALGLSYWQTQRLIVLSRAGALAPVAHQVVPELELPPLGPEARPASGLALEDLDVEAGVRLVRPAAEELARDQRIGRVHPRIELGRDLDVRGHELVPRHVPPHRVRPVRQAAREARVRGQEQ